MDKRITKTNRKILTGFKELIKEKNFTDITIEDIICHAHVARSTFYQHYKTKYDVLEAVVNNIFIHVFGHTLQEEKSHDFSKSSILDYKHYISHILYHLDDEKDVLHTLLNSSSKQYLIDSLIKEFKPFAKNCINNNYFENPDVPNNLLLSSIVGNFVLIIIYWDETNFKDTPEKLTEYFINLNRKSSNE